MDDPKKGRCFNPSEMSFRDVGVAMGRSEIQNPVKSQALVRFADFGKGNSSGKMVGNENNWKPAWGISGPPPLGEMGGNRGNTHISLTCIQAASWPKSLAKHAQAS